MITTIKTTNIQNRKGKLFFRMKVPVDCREALNKKEIVKSLGLKEDKIAQAIVMVADLAAEWHEAFEKIRKSADKQKLAVRTPTGRHVETEVRRELIRPNMNLLLDGLLGQGNLHQCEQHLKDIQNEHDNVLKLLEGDVLDEKTLRNNHFGDVLGAYDQEKWPYSSPLDTIRNSEKDEWEDDETPMDHSVWTLAETLGVQDDKRALRGILRALRDELEYLANEIINEFPKLNVQTKWNPLLKGLQPATALTATTSATLIPVATTTTPSASSVLVDCLAAKERTYKAGEDLRKEVLSLLDWLGMKGDSTPITSITTAHIIDYRDNCLKHLMINANKLKKIKGKPVKEQVAYSKKTGKNTISIATINNRLTCLNIFFNYARKKHFVSYAVSEELQLPDLKKQAKQTGSLFTGYSDTQMNDLIKYLEDNRGKHRKGNEWRYWIPLLLTYTGCRANEIAMLTVDDVKEDNGIWYVDLHTDPGKRQRVKNASSIRKVPICQTVIDLGFIEHVKGIKKKVSSRNNKEGRLWSTLTYCKKNKWVRKLSNYFNNTVRPAIKAKDVSSGLHGIRSSVSRELQRLKVEQRTIDEITGHQPGGLSQVALGYQGRLELKILFDALNKLNWDRGDGN
jgi:integrase